MMSKYTEMRRRYIVSDSQCAGVVPLSAVGAVLPRAEVLKVVCRAAAGCRALILRAAAAAMPEARSVRHP